MKNGRDKQSRLPRRFYQAAGIAPNCKADAWRILLDGRVVKTPLRSELFLPREALAQAVASEWEAQGEHIDPRSMPLTKLANTALDGVRGHEADVAANILEFAGRDLICYRAGAPDTLMERQHAAWDPLLRWAEEQFGARLIATSGVMPVEQPAASIAALRPVVAGVGAFPLAALHTMTTLTGSAILPLAHISGRLSVEACWAAAHVDEDYQIERWGEDGEAKVRRAARLAEMHAASKFFALSR